MVLCPGGKTTQPSPSFLLIKLKFSLSHCMETGRELVGNVNGLGKVSGTCQGAR